MKDRLIVGYDGSAASTNALQWAAREAELRGASVHVLSSYAPPPLLDLGYGAGAIWADDEIPEWTLNHLREAMTTTFEQLPDVDRDFEAVATRPGVALLKAAEDADLLVVGSSGAGAMSHLLLGSVTSELLASSPCPVVVMPAEARAATGRIAVGTDGSDHAGRAVEWAVAEADRRQCELEVVHAWEPPYRLVSEGADGSASLHEVDAELVLERAVGAARELSGGAVESTLVKGGTAQSLLDLAKTADLLVVGSRGRGGFRSMLFGSVAHAVAAHASCPAVIVR